MKECSGIGAGSWMFVGMVISTLMTGAFASISPEGNQAEEPIDYIGPAVPGPVTGSIGWNDPFNPFDWYCATAIKGQEITISLTREFGDLILNAGAFTGIATSGKPFSDMAESVFLVTDNQSSPDVSLTFEPEFTGLFTLWVSTFSDEIGGQYELEVIGAESAPVGCGTVPGHAIAKPEGFDDFLFEPNDDDSLGPLDLDFVVNFFGIERDELWINNNGNITFDQPLFEFTPFDLTSTQTEIIAPFFADVDTSVAGDPVTFGWAPFEGRPAFFVNYINVDYFPSSENNENRNSFQVILVDRSDVAIGDFDIIFNYDQIEWETGMASGGDSDGLGGDSARVGFSNGTGEEGTFFELDGSAVNGAFLADGEHSLIHNSRNSDVFGRYVFESRSGEISAFTVTAQAGIGGSVHPPSASANEGATVSFRVTPDSGFVRIEEVGGTCPPGQWEGDTYTTGELIEACEVFFGFEPILTLDRTNLGRLFGGDDYFVSFDVNNEGSNPVSNVSFTATLAGDSLIVGGYSMAPSCHLSSEQEELGMRCDIESMAPWSCSVDGQLLNCQLQELLPAMVAGLVVHVHGANFMHEDLQATVSTTMPDSIPAIRSANR
jgi:hypothetical protein